MSSDLLQWLCFLMKSQNDVKGNVEMCEYFSNSRRILLVVDNFHVNQTQISMHAGNFPVCNRLNGRLYIPITDKHSIEHLLGGLPQFTYIRVYDVPADLVSRVDGTDLSYKHIGLNNKSLYIIISPLGGRHLDLFRGRRGLGDRWAVFTLQNLNKC